MWQGIKESHKDLFIEMVNYCGQVPDGRQWMGKGYTYKFTQWAKGKGLTVERFLSTVNTSDELLYLCRIKRDDNVLFEQYIEGSYHSWKEIIRQVYELLGSSN